MKIADFTNYTPTPGGGGLERANRNNWTVHVIEQLYDSACPVTEVSSATLQSRCLPALT
jgi:hypothetical protein